MNPKVSVIIPCFNQGQYLDEAVDSILGQTFQDFEIIIINDGSTDEYTINKLENYNKPKTKVIHTENKKLPAARNTGIKSALGEYILTLDSDDKFKPTFIEKAVAILQSDKQVGIVSCYLEAFGKINWINEDFYSGGVELFIGKNNTVACALFRCKCWEQTGGYDEAMIYGAEDWNFWIDITKRGWKVEIIKEPLFMYRQKSNSMSIDMTDHLDKIMNRIIRNHYDLFRDHFVEAIIQRETRLSHVQLSYLKTYLELQYWYKLANQLKNSISYRVGQIIIYPFVITRKLLGFKK